MKITMKNRAYDTTRYFDDEGCEYQITLPMGAIDVSGKSVICIERTERICEHGSSMIVITHQWIDVNTGKRTSIFSSGAEINEENMHNFKKLIKKQENNTGVNLEGAGYKLVDGVWVK